MRSLCVALYLLSVAAQGYAALPPPNCLLSFAAAGNEDGGRKALVVSTFERLLGEVGKVPLRPEDLDAMVSDPFRAPESGDDVLALNRSLATFHELLTKKGWDTPETRGWLAETLRARAVGIRQNLVQRVRAQRANVRTEVAIPGRPVKVVLSPNGEFVLSHDDKTVRITDVFSGQTREFPKPARYLVKPFNSRDDIEFSSDGNGLIWVAQGMRQLLIPVENGEPRWERGRLIGPQPPEKNDATGIYVPLGVPDWAYLGSRVDREKKLHFLLANVKTGVVERRPWPSELPTAGYSNYGHIPGRQSFFKIGLDGEKQRLFLVDYNEKLDFSVVKHEAIFQGLPNRVVFSRDGKLLVAMAFHDKNENQIEIAPVDGGPAQPLISESGKPEFGSRIWFTANHPTRNELLVFYWDNRQKKNRVETVDLATRRTRASVDLKSFSNERVKVTADGELIQEIVTGPNGEHVVKSYPISLFTD